MQARQICNSTPSYTCANQSPTSAPHATRPSPTVPTCLSTPAYILVLNPTGVRSVRESLLSSHIFNNTSEHTRETSLTNAGFQVHIFSCSNTFCIPITFNNPLNACFSNKIYILYVKYFIKLYENIY